MKITNAIKYEKNEQVGLSADLVMDSGKKHNLYFEVDREYERFISKDASPFVAVALPIAMNKKENLEVEGRISRCLLTNTTKLMNILENWNLGYHAITLRTRGATPAGNKPKRSGCFFSGGVDSSYTLLKNKNKIDYLIFVHGFDISIHNVDLYKKVEKHMTNIAHIEQVKLIRVKTNIRETFEQYLNWDNVCEFALAAVSLFLRNGLGEIFVSGGEFELNPDYHFMTPELDSLWSTENMHLSHFGCEISKINKLRFLSRSQNVMTHLRVCWVNKHGRYNCGQCEKCIRTMLTLYVCDALQDCKTFSSPLDSYRLKHMKINADVLPYFIAIVNALKRKNDTSEVSFALEACIKNNSSPKFQKKIEKYIRYFIGRLDKKYNRNRLFWFLSYRGLL